MVTYEDPKVSPSSIITHVQTRVETVSHAELTELTVASRRWVIDVTPYGGSESSSVVAACLTGRCG